MRKIVDYKIVTERIGGVPLEDKVRLYIQDGWQPYGEVLITHCAGKEVYNQVMVKYEEEDGKSS